MSSNSPNPEQKHPEEWRGDLNPDHLAGLNIGPNAAQPGPELRPASEINEAQQRLQEFSNDELRRVPIMQPGSRLKQGATYLDLKDGARGEFTATAEMEATEDTWYVPKSEVDYPLWNRLIGVQNPERLDAADER